jgi:hypothetical protein
MIQVTKFHEYVDGEHLLWINAVLIGFSESSLTCNHAISLKLNIEQKNSAKFEVGFIKELTFGHEVRGRI